MKYMKIYDSLNNNFNCNVRPRVKKQESKYYHQN